MQWATATEEERIRDGTNFIALLWSEIADRVIQKAIQVYELSPEQGDALKRAFRRYEIQLV
jgi:hypothetical protein